jgi:hypothetical protein
MLADKFILIYQLLAEGHNNCTRIVPLAVFYLWLFSQSLFLYFYFFNCVIVAGVSIFSAAGRSQPAVKSLFAKPNLTNLENNKSIIFFTNMQRDERVCME